MAKRKREQQASNSTIVQNGKAETKIAKTNGHIDVKTVVASIQIVAGSYERVLHGITASLVEGLSGRTVQFTDTFLFNAHASAIRCLALSSLSVDEKTDNQTIYLATGGSDERVNVYSLSAYTTPETDGMPSMPTLGNVKISENPRNRELGTLLQHSSNVTALHFPTRSKLLSASEDNTVAISRTRDLTVVSTIKAPRPKVQGQPSGDTAPPGASPAGINDFGVHPSLKLMISVGKGERCMRLWNLVTGKKAGVLNFDRSMLTRIKEGKYSSGEGRRIRWHPNGTEFAVAFERGIIIYGDDSKPKRMALPQPLSKVHQISYYKIKEDFVFLAVSTEDGRVVFYNTSAAGLKKEDSLPSAKPVAQLGGKAAGMSSRVKDFKILPLEKGNDKAESIVVITACSDGLIRLLEVGVNELSLDLLPEKVPEIGTIIGTHETGNRITCLDAYVMIPLKEGESGLTDFEGLTEDEDVQSSSDSDETS